MANPARTLLDKLDADLGPKAKCVKKSANACLADFISHLQWLKSRHCQKSYKDDYLVPVLFQKPRLFASETERVAYCKCHLLVAINQLENLLTIMRDGKNSISHTQFKKHKPLLRDYLFDLMPIVEHLERKKDPRYEFFRGVKAYGMTGWQVFKASKQLSVLSVQQPIKIDHRGSQVASVFMLRQALEVKFERLVAASLHDKTGQTPKVRHDFYYSFIKQNLSLYEFTSVDFSLLRYVYIWCNVFVHRAIQPLAWQLPYALDICSGLFSDGQLNIKGGWSINGGVRVINQCKMQQTFAEYFRNNYKHGQWCIEYGTPEAVCDYYDLE